MLKLLNIVKEYKLEDESIFALNDVSIEFRKNEFVSILGPSGCGKTTLLNIVGGLDRYTSGDIQIEGISTKEYKDVDWDTYRNHRIGFVFQSYNLIPHMNILRNVALSLTLAGISREERYARALEALRTVGLDTQAKKKPNQLSGGQMQRVAIARALVNNPDIILADEPTGALDTESGVQIMDLLKDVAKDRLVIMVTHNPQLAEEYSTRIINLKDGKVVGDSMPYNSSGETNTSTEVLEEPVEEVKEEVQEEPKTMSASAKAKLKRLARAASLKEYREKRKKLDRSSMKLRTAINLSWNNLLSKKVRTLLTSIAGSIGIIGIILVLALSNGATIYIDTLEESALSTYPVTVSETKMDMSSVVSLLQEDVGDREEYPDSDEIYTKNVLGRLIKEYTSLVGQNDLYTFKKYVDQNFDSSLATVIYQYGIKFNAYIQDPKDDEKYMKVNPYSEVMRGLIDAINVPGMDISEIVNNFNIGGTSLLDYVAEMMNPWSQISTNQSILDSQYELVGEKSKWPTAANEIVVVVDEKNQLIDYTLFMLGLRSESDLTSAMMSKNFSQAEFSVDEILGLRYSILTDADYLEYDTASGKYVQHTHNDQTAKFVEDNRTIEVKVVGVVRPKEGSGVQSISSVIGYTQAFMDLLIDQAAQSDGMKQLMEARQAAIDAGDDVYSSPFQYKSPYDETVSIGYALTSDKKVDPNTTPTADDYVITVGSKAEKNLLRSLGWVDKDYPTEVDFYCTSFSSKEALEEFVKAYNADTEFMNKGETDIRLGDTLGTIMEYVDLMTTTITGVLVAFAAISLVVSTIMIAIIIYTSVLERRKEIGVLRSLGARKKDISRVFLAESGILGAYSGAIGTIISVILSFAISAILKAVFKIEGLMTVTWYYCLGMIALSVILSMLAGFIPSRIAANKDPAIALREE